MEIYDKFFDDLIHLSPSLNDYLQLPQYKSLRTKLKNSISPEYIKKTKKFYQKYDKILKEKKSKNIYDKVLKYEIKINLEGYKYNFQYFPIDQMNNIVSFYIQLLNGTGEYLYQTHEDYKAFMIRNRDFAIYCCQMISNMYKGISKKMVLPKPIVKMLISDIENIMNNKDYINPKVPKKLKKEWDKNVEEYVVMPIKNLLLFLKTKYLKAARKTLGYSSLPDGKNMYKYLVKSMTTNSKLSVKQIHELGLKEVKRIFSEMKMVMKRMNYKKDFKHFVKHIKSLKYNKFKNANEAMNHYKNTRDYLWKYIMPEFFDIKIKKNYEIKRVPKATQDSAPLAYYVGGSLDGKRDGVFWLNLRNPKEMLKSDDLTLSKHEGIPGHHFQITLTNESKKIPMFIKIANYIGYIEGWALYAENIGEYEDDLEYFGKLNSEMLRAIRLVVDTGIHYYNWSYKRCFNLFRKYTTMSDGEINAEVYRYVADPGQALAYKIGELTILKLRDEYLKKNNNIKKFHTLVLEDGPLPLDILIDKIKNSK